MVDRKKLTRELLWELYIEKGLTAQEIAQRFGLTEDQVRYLLQKHGIRKGMQRRALEWWARRHKGRVPYRDPTWLERRYVLEGKSIEEIAEEAGVTKMTVYLWLKRYGLLRAREERRKLVAQKLTGREPVWQDPAWLRKRYVDQRKSVREIAAEAGVEEDTIRRWLKRHNISRPEDEDGSKFWHDPRWLEYRYYYRAEPLRKIARRAGVSPEAIRYWMHKWHLLGPGSDPDRRLKGRPQWVRYRVGNRLKRYYYVRVPRINKWWLNRKPRSYWRKLREELGLTPGK